MKNAELLKRIAKLESVNDQLVAELNFLEGLTRELGFAEGLTTLKEAAQEMISDDKKKMQKVRRKKSPPSH